MADPSKTGTVAKWVRTRGETMAVDAVSAEVTKATLLARRIWRARPELRLKMFCALGCHT
jgi:hypothetical protein